MVVLAYIIGVELICNCMSTVLLGNYLAKSTNHSYLNTKFRLSVFKYVFSKLLTLHFHKARQHLYSTFKTNTRTSTILCVVFVSNFDFPPGVS